MTTNVEYKYTTCVEKIAAMKRNCSLSGGETKAFEM